MREAALHVTYWYSFKLVNNCKHLTESQHDLLLTPRDFTSPRSFHQQIIVENSHVKTQNKYSAYSHTGVDVPGGYSSKNKQGYNQIDRNPHGYTKKDSYCNMCFTLIISNSI